MAGKTEADLCCKCFQWTFTSGPVTGKKMIIQVTNTGEDLTQSVSVLGYKIQNEILICVHIASNRKIISTYKYPEVELVFLMDVNRNGVLPIMDGVVSISSLLN